MHIYVMYIFKKVPNRCALWVICDMIRVTIDSLLYALHFAFPLLHHGFLGLGMGQERHAYTSYTHTCTDT